MRGLADAERLRRFLKELAREAEADGAVYLTGGATAVLLGWRESTIDADILFVPEQDATEETIELLEATHYLRNGQDGSGESDGNPDEVRIDRYTALESAMQNLATSLLGLTIQCAKCHDHKFEPLSQRDYYNFQAVLSGVFAPDQWLKPNERFVHASLPGEFAATV